MNLQDQGYRFILRIKGGEVVGDWEHPADIKPGGRDVTDLPDDKMAAAIYDMQDGLTPCRHADMCNDEGRCANGCEARKAGA